jgi:PhnB protein
MSTKILAYAYFEKNCREAMEFYHAALGGELQVQAIKDTPMATQFPAEAQNLVMHAELRLDGETVLMSSDRLEGKYQPGNQFQLMINCGSEEDLRRFFAALSKGGTVISAVRTEFWGAVYGQLRDKFGIEWMLNYGKG